MNGLLGATPTLVMAAVLLVVVGSLPSLNGTRARFAALTFVAVFAAGAAAIWQVVNGRGVMTNTFPSEVIKYATIGLNGAKEDNVLLLEGGSYVLGGVDATIVADELQSLGYSVDVVKLAVSAANHFERYRMQQQLVQRLKVERRKRQRWVYLAEVQLDYDRLPLAQFVENQDSTRAYQYLTLSNSWHVLRALSMDGVEEPMGDWRWPLFRHIVINSFSVGAANRLIPEDEVELAQGRVKRRRPQRFHFHGLSALLAMPKAGNDTALQYPWLTKVREARLRRLWRPYLDGFAYFGLPSTTVAQLKHVRDFCGTIQTACIIPNDADLLASLDDRSRWLDSGHLTIKGAKIYSRWLAREIARVGLLTK